MNMGISARRGLMAAFITAALTLCLAGSAAAAWNPLAPFDYTFSDAGPLSVEYNSDGSAHSVWVYDDGTFREFSADGQTPLYSFTVDYTFATGELSDVAGIAADHANGLLFVADRNNHRVVAFDIGDGTPDPLFQAPGGTPTECPGGGCPTASTALGSFDSPTDVEVVGDEVFVLDSENERIQIFDTQLNLLRVISDPNWEPGIPDVSDGRYPTGMTVNRANGNVVTAMSGGFGIEEHTAAGAFVRTITTDFSWTGALAVDQLNNVLYVGDGSRLAALDYTTGTEITTVEDHSVDGELYANVRDIVLQPVERQLIDSYVFEPAPDSFFVSDTVARFAYDAAPTCQEFSAGTQAPNPVAVQLSCTDASPSPQVTYEITTQPTGGSLTGSTATGAYTYTPNAGFSGTDTFKFRAHSDTGASREYTATIAVLEEVPVIRKTANLSRSSGEIWVKLPGSDQWVRLEKDALVPIGTIIDAADGYCVITFADADGSLYTGTFWGGVFQILQTEGDDPFHVLKLRDDEFPDSPSQAGSAAAAKKGKTRAAVAARAKSRVAAKKGKKKNKLWGKGKGKFRTSGNGSSGSVRGTRWGVTNYENGTVTQVTEGVVVVRDFYRKKSITLRRGQSYFADKNWKKNRRATARAKPRFTG